MSIHVGTIVDISPFPEVRDGEYLVAENGGRDLRYDIEVVLDGDVVTYAGVAPQTPPYRDFVEVIVPPLGTRVVFYKFAGLATFDVHYVPWHEDCDSQGGN